jgi:hypothetical protein
MIHFTTFRLPQTSGSTFGTFTEAQSCANEILKAQPGLANTGQKLSVPGRQNRAPRPAYRDTAIAYRPTTVP